MASASARSSEYECPICHENFSTPKILPCAHHLCHHCLVSWMKSDPQANCPLCREVISDPKERKGKSCEDIADSFLTNVAMEARVECAAILSKSHVCCGCTNTTAVTVCLHCGDMLCRACATVHQNMSVTRHHKLENLSTTPHRLASKRQLSCTNHSDKTTELYCPTHRAAICHVCVTSKHQTCPEVKDLEDTVNEARLDMAALVATLKSGESKLEQAISELDGYLLDMANATQVTLSHIDSKCDRLHASVNVWRKRLREQATEANADAKQKVQERKAALLKSRGIVASYWRLVDSVSDEMPHACAVSDMPSRLSTSVHSLELNVTLPDDLKAVAKTTLKIDESVLELVERELSILGLVRETPNVAAVKSIPYAGLPSVTDDSRITPSSKRIVSEQWQFHTIHGNNIVLTNDRHTAERVTGHSGAIVISSDAMVDNILYEVQLDATTGDTSRKPLWCGVISDIPVTIAPQPTGGISAWSDAVVIGDSEVLEYGEQKSRNVGKALAGLLVGEHLGVMVDADSDLYLYVYGRNQGRVTTHVKRPCYAFFNVYSVYKKVSTLPLTIISRLGPTTSTRSTKSISSAIGSVK